MKRRLIDPGTSHSCLIVASPRPSNINYHSIRIPHAGDPVTIRSRSGHDADNGPDANHTDPIRREIIMIRWPAAALWLLLNCSWIHWWASKIWLVVCRTHSMLWWTFPTPTESKLSSRLVRPRHKSGKQSNNFIHGGIYHYNLNRFVFDAVVFLVCHSAGNLPISCHPFQT